MAVVFTCFLLCSCSTDDTRLDASDNVVEARLSVGRSTYSFNSAYWQCDESGTRSGANAGKYLCQLEFFSLDYYRALQSGKLPSKFSFIVLSYYSDEPMDRLEPTTVKSGEWKLTGAINMPRGKGDSDYYLAEAANHPNGDLVLSANADGSYTVSVNPVYVDYEKVSDKSWFIIEEPFLFSGNIGKVPM